MTGDTNLDFLMRLLAFFVIGYAIFCVVTGNRLYP